MPGHDQVHEHDVGPQLGRRRHRRLPVGRLAHHLDARPRPEEGAQALAHDRVVVDDEHPDHDGAGQLEGHGRAALRDRVDVEGPAEGGRPFLHGDQAEMAGPEARLGRVEPDAVVLHHEPATVEEDVDVGGAGVAHGVVERLLDDPVHLLLDGRFEWPVPARPAR